MLGHKLVERWDRRFEVWTTFRQTSADFEELAILTRKGVFENVDVEQFEIFEKIILSLKPDVIVNAIGIIKQLPSSKDIIKTLTINSIFPHRLAEVALKIESRLICISTDCVFNGEKGNYIEEDAPDAYDLYGKSKNLGEVVGENSLTIRTSIIGREIKTAHSLVEWFLSQRGKKIKGYKRAVFSGFPTIILADILADIIENQPNLSGLYHVSSDPINKDDLLRLLKKEYQIEIDIEPSEEVKIDRSLDSAKFRKITGFQPLSWAEMVKIMAADPTPYENLRK